MLRKVLKYDMKNISSMFSVTYGFFLIFSFMSLIINKISLYTNAVLIHALSNFFFSIYIFTIVGLFLGCFAFIIIDFYKSFLTDRGFLTFTLPVKLSTLIVSKIINAVIWQVITFFVFFLGIIIRFGLQPLLEIIDIIPTLMQVSKFYGYHDFIIAFVILFGIIIVFSLITNPLSFFACMAIGQCFSKQKILASIASYVVLYFFSQIVSVTGIFLFGITATSTQTLLLQSANAILYYLIFICTIQFILCSLYYCATFFSFKKGLNL